MPKNRKIEINEFYIETKRKDAKYIGKKVYKISAYEQQELGNFQQLFSQIKPSYKKAQIYKEDTLKRWKRMGLI